MAQSRPTTTTDGAKALAREITSLKRRVRDLELHPDPPAFVPIGASIYDAIWDSALHYAGGPIRWKAQDIFIDGDGYAEIQINAGGFLPPTYADERWFPYIWYDDGFDAGSGSFTTPSDGVYSAHARLFFSPTFVQAITLEITFTPTLGGTVTVSNAQVIRPSALEDPPAFFLPNYLPIEAAGISYMEAGVEVSLRLHVALLIPPGWMPTDIVFEMRRNATAYPPPIEVPLYGGPGNTGRFSIQKIGNHPAGGAL